MSYKIIATPKFKREVKRLFKKYPSLKAEFALLIELLENSPVQGISLGNNCYKIRVAIASKGKGKSGGARVIVYVVMEETTVYLLNIYDKAEQDTITDSELLKLLKEIK